MISSRLRALGAAIAITLSACLVDGSAQAEMVYRVATMGEPKTLDPHGVSGTWVTEATGLTAPIQIFASGDLIGVLDGNKNLYVKQGITGGWVNEAGNVDDVTLNK